MEVMGVVEWIIEVDEGSGGYDCGIVTSGKVMEMEVAVVVEGGGYEGGWVVVALWSRQRLSVVVVCDYGSGIGRWRDGGGRGRGFSGDSGSIGGCGSGWIVRWIAVEVEYGCNDRMVVVVEVEVGGGGGNDNGGGIVVS
ncbi:hypothetical protein Acr_06g0006020 [Actinidia rufa]|uniref:Uncharacterized protein n=1 Tax=Actinidia rufa TaxID=165716 RepID=A0A7J0EQR6_9ERIC|nr:hypothetical protein Acr_06g0006020 [Actinidia rufa]